MDVKFRPTLEGVDEFDFDFAVVMFAESTLDSPRKVCLDVNLEVLSDRVEELCMYPLVVSVSTTIFGKVLFTEVASTNTTGVAVRNCSCLNVLEVAVKREIACVRNFSDNEA